MNIQSAGLKAYTNALQNFAKVEKQQNKNMETKAVGQAQELSTSFSETLNDSLAQVNSLQADKNKMITSFASGETQNVHELMISMQKASLAMNMTAAVRNKVLEAYRELTRLQF